MQGKRSAIGSWSEALGFDHGSTSSDAGIDPPIFWHNSRSTPHDVLPDFMTSAGDPGNTHLNTVSLVQNLNGWNVGESSSTGLQNHASHNERQYETTSGLSLSNVNLNHGSSQIPNMPLFVQSSSSATPRDLNMNAGFIGHDGDNIQTMDCSNAYKSNVSENTGVPFASSSSDPFGLSPGSAGYMEEGNDGRPGFSLDGRRLSCKRKALEGNTGQSSVSGSSSYFQPAEGSVWHAVSGQYSAGSSSTISTPSPSMLRVGPSEQASARLRLGPVGATSESPLALNIAGNVESSQRNYRVRINSSRQQDTVPINVFSSGSIAGQSSASSQHQSSMLLPLNSMDMSSLSAADNTNPQRQSMHLHALRRTLQSSRWNGGSSSRAGRSSSSGEREAMLHEGSNSISAPRSISEHPMFIPANEMINATQPAGNWNLTGGNISIAGNVASNSQTGSSSGIHSLSGPDWVPQGNPPRYPRRSAEFIRRSLLSSAISEAGDQSNSNSPVPSNPSSQEVAISSGAGNPRHHISRARAALLLERQREGASGLRHSLRALAPGSEGRSRLVSEIRNVLDLMRRGEGLRFEDVMILDQSVLFGMADIHDRHRDMRLDVDNMSYEELLALEERIGNVSTGLTEETILNRLKQRKYFSIALVAQLEVEPCCVCQEEYNDGEDIGKLECGHEFHTACIKQWLMQKNLCPICKTTALSK